MNPAMIKILMMISSFAQLLPGMQMPGNGAPATQDPGAPGLKIRVVAFQALNTPDKTVDPELKPINKLLKELPYDTFRFVNDVEQDATAMIETSLVINALYTFHATLLGTDETGATQVAERIEMFDGTNRVNALSAESTLSPGKWLVFRGLPINQGEMVMMMTLVQEQGQDSNDPHDQDQDQNQDQPQKDSQNKDQQQNQSDEQKEGENKEGEQDREDQEQQEGEQKEGEDKAEAQPQEGEGEGEGQQQDAQEAEQQESGDEAKDGAKMDKPEIAALLDSLEEIDHREQMHQRAPKGRPFFPKSGEWW